MPRLVDHEQRRRHIAEAVLRLTASSGLNGVSLRDVAAEARVSMGMIQHYFTNKDEMLRFACTYLIQRTRDNIARRIEALGAHGDGRAILQVLLSAIIPLTEADKDGNRTWMAFFARAVVEPELGQFMRDTWIHSHEFIAGHISACMERGEIEPMRDPDLEAARGLALVDGLASHVLLGHYTNEQALDVLDAYLDDLFSTSLVQA